MSEFSVESVANTATDAGIHQPNKCVIRVLGVGGGGGNSLQHMINQSLSGVEFIAVNTDAQSLSKSTAPLKVQIGVKLTNGLGAGCDPNKGRKAAEESREDIKKLLQSSQMVFITAGMGGGTGTGAAPIIAEVAQETGALTVAVVTKPFRFEGKRHMVNAQAGISELSKHVDSLIVIDNDKLLKNLGANISIVNAFNEANDVLLNAVKGITDSITQPGFINLDFADVVTVMRGRGHAMIGNGIGQGANFVEDAIQHAIHSPLIEQVDISSAAGLLVNARVNPNFPIGKWQEISDEIQSYADDEADCKFGLVFDDKIPEDQISITILVTGISGADIPGSESPAAVARAQASIRRNNLLNQNQYEGGLFQMAQQRQPQPQPQPHPQHSYQAAAAPMTQNVRTQSYQQPPFTASRDAPLSAVRPMNAEEPQPAPVNIATSNLRAKEEDPQALWEVPPILRNNAQ